MEHPELGAHVWGVSLYGGMQDREECFREVHMLLKVLSALRNLKLPHVKCSKASPSVFDIPMSHLRSLSFYNYGKLSSVHEVTKAFSFPHIRRLWIESNCFGEEDDRLRWTLKGTAFDALAGTSSVKDLTLEGWFDSAVLDSSLLKVPHVLEKLTCVFVYTGRFTPKGTIDALENLHSTLVFLDLSYSSFRVGAWGPLADISCFISLKTLAIDDALCFELSSRKRPEERCGFYKRLPPTLKALHVSVKDAICYGLRTLLTS
jgi:hypothetical protein